MKRTTAKALTVVTTLAVAGTVAGAGAMTAVDAAPTSVRAGSFTAVPASYDTASLVAARQVDRATFAERAARDAKRDAAHLRQLRKQKAAKLHAAKVRRAKARHARLVAARRAHARHLLATGTPRQIGRSMAASRGWTGAQWAALDRLWTAESGWSTTAANGYGAYGIPQALPGSKMAGAGSDWRSSARTQIAWGLSYIAGRWGSPAAAWSHFQYAHWY